MKAQILTVVPLSKSLPQDHLTYFSTKEVSLGDIVEIPIKKRTYKGLIIKIDDAQKNKAELKDSSFQLKAITKIVGTSPFPENFFKIVKEMKRYHLGTNTQILNDLLPKILIEHIDSLEKYSQAENPQTGMRPEKLLFQNPYKDRVAYYKTHIRESFARGESVRICVPTIQKANLLAEELKKGIQEYCVVFHSKKTKKKIIEQFNLCQTTPHPLCIIHTPSFLCVPRADCKTYIVENESSTFFRSLKKPFIDFRLASELYAKENRQKFILADTLLRTETLVRHSQGEFGVIGTLHFRIESNAHHKIIDMRASEGSDRILSNTVLQEIVNHYKAGKKIVLFALRSSLANTIVCKDCGTTQTYKGYPVSLHENKETGERFLKSKKYNKILSADTNCSECGSWDLVPLGIGTEKIESIVKELGKQVSITRIDQTSNNTQKQAEEAIQKFYETSGGSILITSPAGLPFLTKPIELSCIVSFDSLFNIPQYNMYEQIMHIVMDISLATSEKLYIQTRYANQKITSILQNKKLSDFFEYDFEERKHWNFPPFCTIIKMNYEGPQDQMRIIEEYVQKTFEEYEMFVYHTKALKPLHKTIHIALKIPEHIWPLPGQTPKNLEEMQKLYKKLAFLPSSWTIIINPHNLL